MPDRKKPILFMLLSATIVINSYGQTQLPKDPETGSYAYQGKIQVDSVSKQTLYLNAKSWVVRTLKSSDNMLELDDKEFNTLVASGTVILDNDASGNDRKLNFKLAVAFKDGKFKYSFENFTYVGSVIAGPFISAAPTQSSLEDLKGTAKTKENILSKVDATMKNLEKSFVSAVKKSTLKKDDW